MKKSPIKNEKAIKNLSEKAKIKNLNDEIELKEIQIKETTKSLNNIKTNSLKEFVYANRTIPQIWKNKFNYQNQVLELFVKDKNFLSYVGNSSGSNENAKSATKLYKPKYRLKNYNRPYSYRERNPIVKMQEESSFPISRNESSLNQKSKLNHQKNNEKRLNNVFDSLQNLFPIKGKLKELFPEEILKSINMKNKEINNKDKLKLNSPEMKKDKRRNIFRQNIFVNLIPQKNKNKSKRTQSAIMRSGYKKNKDIFFKKKLNIKNETIMKNLESINFFGPYYSYCPPCGNRNVDFYKNLDKEKLIQIIQLIKKIKYKTSENLSDRLNINKG